jgi:hypothetical protein
MGEHQNKGRCMTITILCNVGARDLMLRQDGKLEELRPARSQGEKILAQYPEFADRLVCPIIEPVLRYIFSREPAQDPNPSKTFFQVVLFGTDQPEPAHQPSDTLFFAQAVARKLEEIFADQIRVQTILVQHVNPSMYDEVYEKFGELLHSIPVVKDDPVYVILAGGIPACNTALLLQGVRLFGKRLTALYLPQGGDPQPLRVGRQIMHSFSEAAAMERLHALDFANALPHLVEVEPNQGLVGLVRYAAQRLAFDFRSAQQTLELALADGDHLTRQFICTSMRSRLDVLLDPTPRPERLLALLSELYWNARITYIHRQYADFLGRVYRFQEAILRYLIELIFHLSTDLGPGVRQQNQQDWEESLGANPSLVNFCENRLIDGEPINWRNIGRPTYHALLSYAVNEKTGLDAHGKPLLSTNDQQRFRAMLSKINALDRLVELRHRTIIGHDFVGVSEDLLLRFSPEGKSPPDLLAEIMQLMLKRKLEHSDYEQIAAFVVEQLHGKNP